MTSRAQALNARIDAGSVSVQPLHALRGQAHAGPRPDAVDLVTLAFAAPFSGSAVMMCVPVAGRGVFTRAEEIRLNGLPGHPGPAPNERLGVVDTMLFADERDECTPPDYDGAALLLDLLAGRPVEVACRSVEHTMHRNTITLASTDFARFYVYNAALPPGVEALSAVRETLVPGARVVLNGAQGIYVGAGTRNRPGKATLSLTADMHDMDASLLAFEAGRPCHLVALAIAPRDAGAIAELLAWAATPAGGMSLTEPAMRAAQQLATLVRSGKFRLAETGAADTPASGH